MPKASRFDQRAVALVELRGTQTEFEMFEGALADRGWPVLAKHGGAASAVTERGVKYTVEARFPGSAFNAVRGARERIEVISDELQLDLNVEVVDRVVRDPIDRPYWFAYERPEVRPDPSSASGWQRRSERWRVWAAEKLGSRDTGRHITAVSVQAARLLADRPLPGARPRAGGAAVRRPLGVDAEVRVTLGTSRESAKLLPRVYSLAALELVLGTQLAGSRVAGFGWWMRALLVCVVVWTLSVVLRRVAPEMRCLFRFVTAVVIGGAGVAMGAFIVRTEPAAGYGARIAILTLGAVAVLNGVRLLVRQWSWQRTAPWLLPALLPIFLGFLSPLGLGLHPFYLDAFRLNREDIEIPEVYQLLASLKLAMCMSLWLVALAFLGYMKHLHLYVKDRWLANMLFLVLSTVLLVSGVGTLGVLSAARAGTAAVADAKHGRTPRAYFGIAPEWVCAHPIGKPETIPVDGGEFVPVRPYLKVGDAADTVVLWDADNSQALKMPMARLRIVPAEERRPASCG
ncbi:hypothetical protein [Streptomyces sp. NPDC048462]|uniref:hypothetical protein n=1 Tax=Streptomyces sp. NPDC048462 TaxID=3365555 RepID=UPI003714EBC6